jgi:hypothetical protein
VFYNDGKGGFKIARPIGKFLNASYAITSADFNNDGLPDIVEANSGAWNLFYLTRKEQ